MALSARQLRLYRHQCDVWAPTQAFDANGVALDTGESWAKVNAQPVSCFFEINPNVDAASEVGRYQTDSIFTLDLLHLAVDETIGPDYLVKNLTLESDGVTRSSNYGQCWRVRGPIRGISNSGVRRAGKRALEIYRIPPAMVPDGVS